MNVDINFNHNKNKIRNILLLDIEEGTKLFFNNLKWTKICDDLLMLQNGEKDLLIKLK